MSNTARRPALYRPAFEHDACGVGFLADLQGRRRADLLPLALQALGRLAHRGAVDADGRTGDGAGVLTQVPYGVLEQEDGPWNADPPALRRAGIGLLFLPPPREREARALVEGVLAADGLRVLGWRDVPVRREALGDKARRSCPILAHVVVGRPEGCTDDAFERDLHRVRRRIEAAAAGGLSGLYVASLSHRTLVYKALARARDLPDVFPDLRHPAFTTAFAVFHQRFSTNTFPNWAMAQPFRMAAHNGEINTIQGNRAWMRARGLDLSSGEGVSDSATLDEALVLLVMAGRDALHAMSMLIPPAWENDPALPPAVRDFFAHHACRMEPWDGPALVAFTDGRVVGAALDRNGLRPARYVITTDGLALVASEAGVLDLAAERVLHRGRLGPGEIVAVDLQGGRWLDAEAIHGRLAASRPNRKPTGNKDAAWRSRPGAGESAAIVREGALRPDILPSLRAFAYTREELLLVLGPMALEGREPLGSMGDDTPLAVLSRRPRLLFSYFKQRFAQVTNPPIDPLRESLVMSLRTCLGPRPSLLGEGAGPATHIHRDGPLVDEDEVEALLEGGPPGWSARRLHTTFPADGGPAAFARALDALVDEATEAVRDGAALLVLSDRDIGCYRAALPSLLAVSAVHQALVRSGLRTRTSLVAETGEARDDHQVAALIGFGAEAVSPYLALRAIRSRARGEEAAEESVLRYRAAIDKGLLKILSKMGISTLRSYHGAQLFEVVGLSTDLVARHFTGTPSAIGGVGLEEIARETLARHGQAFSAAVDLEEGGEHRFRQHGESHAFAPEVVKTLHAAARSGQRLDHRRFADLVHAREPVCLRDLLELRPSPDPLPIEEVEPASGLLRRFMTSAMSLGALSPEAQEVLAVAMNRVGARSNSGEGGEAPEAVTRALPGGDRAHNRIKQVASARFGVTAFYLASADELQIKMAQGSKPGEGGQLPGHKVAEHIARVRHAPPGTTLISPPPHHDIYSIEDLAQLVYDLKRVNPAAAVGVKLVSQVGIGTIAAGVVKAHADAVLVAGHDGGTGASPLGSIKNVGTPWELGLAEVQQVLLHNGLRGRVRLQVEGGLKTGRDVVMAALLGADEFGFGSAALVAAGCVMARQCHLNTCPAGIATQREDLRRRFRGRPEDVIRFFTGVAEEVREILAALGHRRLEDVIGRVELLGRRPSSAGSKASTVDLSALLEPPADPAPSRRCHQRRNNPPTRPEHADDAVLARLRFGGRRPHPLRMSLRVRNTDRTVGARIAGELARRYGVRRLPAATLRLRYQGSAGQSFGAFCVDGMQLRLEGEANDGLGKGMSGGEIAVRAPAGLVGARDDVVAGNAVLYGATGGRLFLAGRAGERFAVRNSGAVAVVEGTGDHACEYMTAGVVVILGPVGRNFGAGMSGGVAYLLDADGDLAPHRIAELVTLAPHVTEAERDWLRAALVRHVKLTASPRGRALLASWPLSCHLFRRIAPSAAPPRTLPPMRPRRPKPLARLATLAGAASLATWAKLS